jgi:tRNA nucleotidyltransferase/poly(A) polymerase
MSYEKIGTEIGKLVQEKNEAYGDSFGQSCKILEVLYPEGIKPDQYRDALAITRVIDKLFRLANKKDAFGESPWRDICGYAILGVANDENPKQ